MQYDDYIIDFPTRCETIFDKCLQTDDVKKYNVTLLLSLATTAFTVPFERLDDNHFFKDKEKEKFKEVATRINNKLKEKAKESSIKNWYFYKGISEENVHDQKPEDWQFNKIESLDKSRELNEFVRIVRNALAHGNILTTKDGNGEIDKICFITKQRNNNHTDKLSEIRCVINGGCKSFTRKEAEKDLDKIKKILDDSDKYKAVQCSVEEFENFLKEWISILKATD